LQEIRQVAQPLDKRLRPEGKGVLGDGHGHRNNPEWPSALIGLLEKLNLGESVTLVGSEGVPQALLVSLKPVLRETQVEADSDVRWEALARQVSEAWQSKKSAVELLSEMRR
jgi:hypothetical protein